ncbi:hypothetical protein Tco_1505968, partial [Tanacetum coccineum]
LIISNLDIIGVIEDEERFGKLSDDDAIRLCFLLALEVIFMGQLLTFKVDDTLFSSTSDLRPTIAEYQSSWWINNNVYFHEHVPKAPPIREQHSLFETYLSKLEKARKRGKIGFMVSSIGGTSDNSVRKKWLNDLVIVELNFRVLAHDKNDRHAKLQFIDEFSSMTSNLCDSLNSMFVDLIQQHDSDVDIAQDYLQDEELRLCLEDEEMLRCEHEKLIVKENRLMMDEANKLRLEEENMVELAEQKKNKIFHTNLWLKLVCLDPARKGWLNEEHIDLWVDYMWHVRTENANWAMVSCYFVQLLLQKGMPLFYANGERYTTPWSEVE